MFVDVIKKGYDICNDILQLTISGHGMNGWGRLQSPGDNTSKIYNERFAHNGTDCLEAWRAVLQGDEERPEVCHVCPLHLLQTVALGCHVFVAGAINSK